MNSIFKTIVLSELKFIVIILFILALITVIAGQGTRKSHLNNSYSTPAGSNRTAGVSAKDPFILAGEFGDSEQNDSTKNLGNNHIHIIPASNKSEENEGKNLTSAHNPTYVLCFSLFQYSIIPLFQTEYSPFK
ncbi:MAG: hypothetical protein AMS27_09475 [Bacteroides sp. SM23_62_1]|nr:MAG: hypothetical protein AMS27_09475 [Bacteroides sp. SM23_62_1]